MLRRIFFKIIIGIIGLLLLGLFSIESTLRNKIIGKIKFLLKPPQEVQPYSKRSKYGFPTASKTVSVEMALNSRCTSDYTGNQKYHHWGMFDKAKMLTDEQINWIVDLSKIPRFTLKKIGIVAEKNMFTFIVENIPSGLQRDWLMVESGMQQQAVGLVCSALGVGMVFRNLGKDGRLIENNNSFGTVRIKVDPMQPSYDESFWSTNPPSGRKPWLKGNLSNPVRNGEMPLISALADLRIENQCKTKANNAAISQLLWAARGRTPHLYKAKPWGMTIPFWTDKIEISSVYLAMDQNLYKYINWESGRPTHSIVKLCKLNQHATAELLKIFPQKEKFIFIGRNDNYARATWEIGYQLINLLLQAKALDVAYQTILLDETLKKLAESIGISNPVALLAV